jgi:GT2 family glycosyltransferase
MRCADALRRGDLQAAYRLADRRCRIRPLPDSHCYVLRAEALHRMGDRAGAVDDLVKAIEIAPEDITANRRMIVWGDRHQQLAAAKTLIDCEQDASTLRQAIAMLCSGGQTACATVRVREDAIEGWAAWQGDGRICVSVAGEADCVDTLLDADAAHPMSAELGNAVGFRLPRQRGSQFISVRKDNDVLVTMRTTGHDDKPRWVPEAPTCNPSALATVIVPVFADYDATKACLESLLPQTQGDHRTRVIIANDATPDRHIQKLLDGLTQTPSLQVLTNARNFGFVGAVNRALQHAPSGDVVLLNADTIVPPAFIGRLALAARSAADIGTVTPFSNNGEFTSFPIPNRANTGGDARAVAAIDRIAADVNAGVIVDIPNGIGFCLYITRACLDAVGFLSEGYYRGYLEDVDFCLRARMRGFRSVCATSVYVGHAGSRSFAEQKRSLVVRNLKIVEERFPAYRAECADFVLADPLHAARNSIERRLVGARTGGILLVTSSGALAEVARDRSRHLLAARTLDVLVLEIKHLPQRIVAQLRDAADVAPQSLEFPITMAGAETNLFQFLQRLQLARIELFDLVGISRGVLDALLKLSVPYDIFMADPEMGLRRTPLKIGKQLGPRLGVAGPDIAFLCNVASKASRLLVPDAQAEAIASSLSLHHRITALPWPKARKVSQSRNTAQLGLVPVRRCVQEHQFMRGLIAAFARLRPDLDIVVVGATHGDSELMQAGRAFVTGPVVTAELDLLLGRYRLDRIVLCLTQPLFGHPMTTAVTNCALPVAYIDWSDGRCPLRNGDLPLDPPGSSAAAVARRLLPWLGEPRTAFRSC